MLAHITWPPLWNTFRSQVPLGRKDAPSFSDVFAVSSSVFLVRKSNGTSTFVLFLSLRCVTIRLSKTMLTCPKCRKPSESFSFAIYISFPHTGKTPSTLPSWSRRLSCFWTACWNPNSEFPGGSVYSLLWKQTIDFEFRDDLRWWTLCICF